MSKSVMAYGVIAPDGELLTTAGFGPDAVFVMLAKLLGKDIEAAVDAMKDAGYRSVKVEIRTIEPYLDDAKSAA